MSYLEDGFSKVQYWNPVAGCTAVGEGCKNCYALDTSWRIFNKKKFSDMLCSVKKDGGALAWTGEILPRADQMERPNKRKKPTFFSTGSLSDLFHPGVTVDVLGSIFDVMNQSPQHLYQVITRQSARMLELSREITFPERMVLGVAVENESALYRIDDLRRVDAGVTKFVCFEPLLGPIRACNLDGIDGVAVGGEFTPRKTRRTMEEEWVAGIRDLCLRAEVPFYFSHWGGRSKRRAGRALQNQTWNRLPATVPDAMIVPAKSKN